MPATNRAYDALNHWHPAYNGTKIVTLGGNPGKPNSIYLLDATTLVWTKGAASKPGYGRSGSACAVVGDYFIVVGGTCIK